MNRNQIIGTIIGKTLGYTVQGFMCTKIAAGIHPVISSVALKGSLTYGVKFIQYASENCVRTDFSSERIFFDAIDASFFADWMIKS